MTDLPTVIDSSGLVPTAPATLRSNTVTYAQSVSSGITTDLPGTLIEDLGSTSTGALVQIDQARVDAVNSITPYGCNDALLDEMGTIYGLTRGTATNTSAYVTFTGTPGYDIPKGFTVTDGTYQYSTQEAAAIGTSGSSGNVYVVATVAGSWAVAAGSITQVVTSVPTDYTVTVTNAATGTPGDSDGESDTSFRYRCVQAASTTCQSAPRYVKTKISDISGVSSRLVSMAIDGSNYRIMVGGGDPYLVAGAIYNSVFDLPALVGSVNSVTGATQASAAVITTELTHGLTDGASVTISGAEGMTAINGTFTMTYISPTSFSIPVDTSSASAYTGSGVLETNPRNEVVSIVDGADTYQIPFVVPLQQIVKVSVVWNTNATNVVSNDSVVSLGQAALTSYINGIYAGAPINRFEMQYYFQNALVDLVPYANLTRMVFTVYIDGVEVDEDTGTGLIQGDSQSYLYTVPDNITITRG